MLVSFYAQLSVICLALFVALLPFLGFPQSWDMALTAVLGTAIFGVATHALYKGYVRVLQREEKREQRVQKIKKEKVRDETPVSGEVVKL